MAAGVPNPLAYDDVALNLAHVATGVGVAMLVAGALSHAWTNRERLLDPV